MGRQFTKGIDLVDHQMKRFAAANMTAKQGHRDIAEAGRQDLLELTCGDIKEKTLIALGHPFGRRMGAKAALASAMSSANQSTKQGLNPLGSAYKQNIGMRGAPRSARRAAGIPGVVPLLPINEQSGRLHSNIRLQNGNKGIQSFNLKVVGVPYAKYILAVGGTSKMVARGAKAELIRRWKARNAAFKQYFVRKQNTI